MAMSTFLRSLLVFLCLSQLICLNAIHSQEQEVVNKSTKIYKYRKIFSYSRVEKSQCNFTWKEYRIMYICMAGCIKGKYEEKLGYAKGKNGEKDGSGAQ
ncbi:hypothetical protein Leryth_020533 [Lithospermum erythrorhizon]|nr:hypothetical protein Leryth_020533 [Lithospermum erythrorhizon]